VALDLVPNAPNGALLELFQSCDRDGGGNIDYTQLAQKLQAKEAAGQPVFIPGYRGGGAAQVGNSRMGPRTTPGTLLAATQERLNVKHKMLKQALTAADPNGAGTVPLATLKQVLVSLNVVSKQQLSTGELDDFLNGHSRGGNVNYKQFADSVKAQDLAQLDVLRKTK
jgi:Ca2+-binding EF-hand superfamily protein